MGREILAVVFGFSMFLFGCGDQRRLNLQGPLLCFSRCFMRLGATEVWSDTGDGTQLWQKNFEPFLWTRFCPVVVQTSHVSRISSFIYCHVAGIKRTQKKKHHRDTLPSFAVPWTLSAPFCLGSLKLRAGEPKAGLFSVPIELALEIEQRSASC